MNAKKKFINVGLNQWALALLLSFQLSLAMPTHAYADTYNFFFSKGKKGEKQKPAEGAQTPGENAEENSADSQGEEAESEKPKDEASSVEKTPGATPPAADYRQPIIINNNLNSNNTGVPVEAQAVPTAAPPSPLPVPVVTPAQEGGVGNSPKLEASYENPDRVENHRWKISVSTVNYREKFEPSSYWGAMLTLGYSITRQLGFTLYTGSALSSKGDYDLGMHLHAGGDFEIYPLVIPTRDFNTLELGVLLGASTAAAAHDNIGSFHTGARLNINLNERFGLTAISRVNLGYVMFEAGIAARM